MTPKKLEPSGEGASPDGLPPLRDVIRAYDLAARKSLGQNFILDLNLTRRIARAAGPLDGAVVVEVGPGPGGLTRGLLLEGARQIIAIEADQRCIPALEEIAGRHPGRLKIVLSDATTVDWPRLIADIPGKAIIAANLPYYVATRLVIQWLETEPWPPWWHRMALMFQREVADRIVAAPGTKSYGRLAVIAQWRTRARIALTLGPEAFTPPPKVASAIVVFEPRSVCDPACCVITLGRVTGAAFGQRRKMLRQSLRLLGRDTLALLEIAGIEPERRAEELTPSEFAGIAAAMDAGAGL